MNPKLRGIHRGATALLMLAALSSAAWAGVAPQTLLGHPIEYVIVTEDSLVPAFVPLADWRTRTGIPAVIAPLSLVRAAYPVAADDPDRVRRFLRDAHQLWGVHWALLGGGAALIPPRLASTAFYGGAMLATDLYYSCLDGTWDGNGNGIYGEGYVSAASPGDSADLVADIDVGRAPVLTRAEAERFVTRTLDYEGAPRAAPARVLGAGEVLFPQDWTGGPPALDGAQLIEELLPEFDRVPALVARLYENVADPNWRPGALPESRVAVIDSLDAGPGVALLIGQGDDSTLSVADGRLTPADAAALTNTGRPFNVYSVGGSIASFAPGGLGRALMIAPGGGAVSCIASSQIDFPTTTRAYLDEFWRLVVEDGVRAIGEAHARSRLPFVPFSSFDGVQRWTQMSLTLLGDPALRLRLAGPHALDVVAPSEIAFGGTSFDVAVESGGAPLAGARVTAYRAGRQLGLASTGIDGLAHVPYEAGGRDTFDLTVVADDCEPFEARVAVLDQPTPLLPALREFVATSDSVRMVWSAPGRAGESLQLERRARDESPHALANLAVDGTGSATYVDREVRAGERLGYDLVIGSGPGAFRTPVAWIEVPAAPTLALLALEPNPGPGRYEVRLALPGNAPARLEVLDVSGRRVAAREIQELGPGTHQIRLDLAPEVPAGLYLVRLSASGRAVTRRIALIR